MREQMTRHKFTQAERHAIYDKCFGHCAYCGCELPYKKMQVDHIVAIHRKYDERTNDLKNLLPSCRSCNKYKHTLTLNGFRNQLERMPIVLARDSVTYKIAVRYGLVKPCPHRVEFYFEQIGIEVEE